MIGLVLLSAAGIALSVLLIKVATLLGERYFVRIIGSALRDAERIVNEGELPDAWVQPFRQRIDTIRRKGGSESKMERVGRKARQRCLHNLDALTKFFQERDVTDSEATRNFLLASLKEQRERVAAAAWQDLLGQETDARGATELTSEG